MADRNIFMKNQYICNMDKNRYNEIECGLASSIKMKLNQIRTFLDLGKASVMVGAGFGKNAKMGEDVHMKD